MDRTWMYGVRTTDAYRDGLQGFMEGYLRWTKHGEDKAIVSDDDIITDEEANDTPFDIDLDPDDHMSDDAESGPDLEQMLRDFEGQGTNTEYEKFVGLMSASEKPLFQ